MNGGDQGDTAPVEVEVEPASPIVRVEIPEDAHPVVTEHETTR